MLLGGVSVAPFRHSWPSLVVRSSSRGPLGVFSKRRTVSAVRSDATLCALAEAAASAQRKNPTSSVGRFMQDSKFRSLADDKVGDGGVALGGGAVPEDAIGAGGAGGEA